MPLEISKKSGNFANVIKIDRHIEILLLNNDCVIVPGLGGFVAYHVNARFAEEDNLYLPPYRTLGFNPLLTMNDSLLVQSYIETYDISYPEAINQIEDEVKAIRHQLSEVGMLELNDLGKLVINKEGNLEFEPYESGILTPEYYGLNSFEAGIERQAEATGLMPTDTTSSTSGTMGARIVSIERNQLGDKRLSISIKALREGIVAAVLLTTVLLIAFSSNHRTGLPSLPVKSGIFYNLFDSSDTPSVASQAFMEKPVRQKNNAPYWAIVLASHITEANAQIYLKQLNEKGLSSAYIHKSQGVVKMLYGKFATSKEAYDSLRTLRQHEDFKQSWVAEINKK